MNRVVGLPLDEYEAVNLLEALKVIPNNGDWYGQVVHKLEGLYRLVYGSSGGGYPVAPNQTANAMRARIAEAVDREPR